MSLHLVYKQKGETPLEALEKLRAKKQLGKDVSLTYAGRLDPAAEGLLLILSGDDVYRKEEFLSLPKTYEFEVLFGVITDTLDVLGLADSKIISNNDIAFKISNILSNCVGAFEWDYPVYSSKTVQGKPLFQYAREDMAVEVPQREMIIETLEHLNTKTTNLGDLKHQILETIACVQGDFRQEEILKQWDEVFETSGETQVCVSSFRARVSSGTYIRVLAQKMGEVVGLPALALSIKRIQIGDMSLF